MVDWSREAKGSEYLGFMLGLWVGIGMTISSRHRYSNRALACELRFTMEDNRRINQYQDENATSSTLAGSITERGIELLPNRQGAGF